MRATKLGTSLSARPGATAAVAEFLAASALHVFAAYFFFFSKEKVEEGSLSILIQNYKIAAAAEKKQGIKHEPSILSTICLQLGHCDHSFALARR